MNNGNKSNIHDFDFNLICEYFSLTERQGPGSREMTLKALNIIGAPGANATIADLGCGTGSSALIIAETTKAQIIAVDIFDTFLQKVQQRAQTKGLNIHTLHASMDKLPFAPRSLDIIWCEGAIYNIGIESGLKTWYPLLKDEGHIAFTDATWLTEERPEEIENFWQEAYPQMGTIESNLKIIEEAGYQTIEWFVLPRECWTENFYEPQRAAQRVFLSRHRGNPTAEMLVENQRHEAEMYSRYGQHYGYVFYIARKR